MHAAYSNTERLNGYEEREIRKLIVYIRIRYNYLYVIYK